MLKDFRKKSGFVQKCQKRLEGTEALSTRAMKKLIKKQRLIQ